ncbi:MAG: hypothetical protein ACD_21C00310G0001 [uncultured bacterium]|nr:MAG: hypothetical protein ACD_21C00310G0001 [uncultured bacterium]
MKIISKMALLLIFSITLMSGATGFPGQGEGADQGAADVTQVVSVEPRTDEIRLTEDDVIPAEKREGVSTGDQAQSPVKFRKRLSVKEDGESVYSLPLRNPYYNTAWDKWGRSKRLWKKHEVTSEVVVQNGSVVLFSSKGLFGRMVKTTSAANLIPNPLSITHAGLIIIENPRVLYNQILDLREQRISDSNTKNPLGKLKERQAERALQMLEQHCSALLDAYEDPGVFCIFTLESNGSPEEVIADIEPDVRLYYFPDRISTFDGNVIIRPFKEGAKASQEQTRQFINDHLGRPYVDIFYPGILLHSVFGENVCNDTGCVFCSELVAMWLKHCKLIASEVDAVNVIPEDLSHYAEDADVVKDIAEEEIFLRRQIAGLSWDTLFRKMRGNFYITCGKLSCCVSSNHSVSEPAKVEEVKEFVSGGSAPAEEAKGDVEQVVDSVDDESDTRI